MTLTRLAGVKQQGSQAVIPASGLLAGLLLAMVVLTQLSVAWCWQWQCLAPQLLSSCPQVAAGAWHLQKQQLLVRLLLLLLLTAGRHSAKVSLLRLPAPQVVLLLLAVAARGQLEALQLLLCWTLMAAGKR